MAVLPYLDDVVVFAESFSQHLERLPTVLEFIRAANLTLKNQKYHFVHKELKFIGHIVSVAGVKPDLDKLAAVAEFPTPRNKKALRRFPGLCHHYRRSIENSAHLAEPLTLELISHIVRLYPLARLGFCRATLPAPSVARSYPNKEPTLKFDDDDV